MIRTAARLFAATVLLVPLLLATVAVAPAMAGGGCHGIDGTVHTEGPSTVVRMDVCSYAPTVVYVPVGTEVRFLNTAQLDHLVVGESRTWGTETELAPGEAYSRTFARWAQLVRSACRKCAMCSPTGSPPWKSNHRRIVMAGCWFARPSKCAAAHFGSASCPVSRSDCFHKSSVKIRCCSTISGARPAAH